MSSTDKVMTMEDALKNDIAREEYRYRVETGQLTAEEERDRNEVMDYLGTPEKKTYFHNPKPTK
jgi:hypothetical protein